MEEKIEEEETSEKSQEKFEDLEKKLEKELTSEELKERNKQLFARTKKAEEKAKRFEAELLLYQSKKEESKKEVVSPDIAELAKKISALKEYNPEELDHISLISKAKDIPLEEAARSEEVQLYIKARREKVAKETTPPQPSTKSLPEKKEFSEWTTEDVKTASLEDLEEFRKWAKAQKR